MKKTVTANIGGIVFHVDEDAYEQLFKYLSSIKAKYQGAEGSEEIINDIELRIAELLQEKISNSKQVVTVGDVEAIILIMGKVEQFDEGNENHDSHQKEESYEKEGTESFKKLYRDDDDKIIAGVCSGIAAYFNTDPLWVRIGFIIGTLIFSAGFWIYLILWVIVPKARTTKEKLEMKGKKINISNIENTIKEDLHDLKDKFKNINNKGNDSEKKNINNRNGFEKFIRFSITLFKYFFKSISIIIGIVFIFLGIFLLIGFISTFFNAFPIHISSDSVSISQISITQLLEIIYPSTLYILVTIIGIILLIATPLIMFVYYGFKLVFGFKYSSKLIGVTTFSLWIIGLVLCIISSFQVFRHFSNKGIITEKVISKVDYEQKVFLNISTEGEEEYILNNTYHEFLNMGIASEGNTHFLIGKPKIEIIENDAKNEIEVLMYYASRGKHKEEALKNAKNILYEVNVKDTIISLPAYFTIKDEIKWRNQTLNIQIKVPSERNLIFSKSTKDYLDNIH